MFGRITLATVLLEALIVIVLESIIAAIFIRDLDVWAADKDKSIPVYLIIFILAQLFQIILCWDAVWHKNTIQILGFVFFNMCATGYSIFQVATIPSTIQTRSDTPSSSPLPAGFSTVSDDQRKLLVALLTTVPVVMVLFLFAFSFLAYKLYIEFGWKIYKKIGADPEMRAMFRAYQIFLMLLKLDVFFIFGFGIQFLVLIIVPSDPEFALTIAAIPVLMTFLALAVYAVRREDKWIMGLFMFGLLMGLVYFLFKLFRIYTQIEKYQFTKRYLTFFACICLLMVSLTFGVALYCYRSFGKGLKQHLAAPDDDEGYSEAKESDFSNASQMQTPISRYADSNFTGRE
ncbi:hypothetical protein HDU67_007107 [Dinochytrium kinnereticum]|nr:hypothetical protein HDU67_007107 [Dinochytrium kinnereticum]